MATARRREPGPSPLIVLMKQIGVNPTPSPLIVRVSPKPSRAAFAHAADRGAHNHLESAGAPKAEPTSAQRTPSLSLLDGKSALARPR
jgi:hypothetical protein